MTSCTPSLAQEGVAENGVDLTSFDLSNPYISIGIALALGLLVGLQRERGSPRRIAGIRTFPMITLLGAIGGILADSVGWWPLIIAGLGVVASITVGAARHARKDDREPGITTEMAILVMFLVGVLTSTGYTGVGVVVTGVVALLLHMKGALHDFAEHLGERDVRAVMQFTLITFVILPVLPNRTFGPFDVLNPREIWLFVVLVVSMSLAGYISIRVVGERAGTVVHGLLGGAISSTATTISHAQRIRAGGAFVAGGAMAIMLASMVSFVRVLIEIGIVADEHFSAMAPPIVVMIGTTLLLAAALFFFPHEKSGVETTNKNPAELKLAIVYGGIFALVIFGIAAAKHFIGTQGAYAVGILSGIADMDAITLSTARMVRDGAMEPDVGWRVILLASISNLIFKGAVATIIGGRRLGVIIAPLFAITIGVGIILIITGWG